MRKPEEIAWAVLWLCSDLGEAQSATLWSSTAGRPSALSIGTYERPARAEGADGLTKVFLPAQKAAWAARVAARLNGRGSRSAGLAVSRRRLAAACLIIPSEQDRTGTSRDARHSTTTALVQHNPDRPVLRRSRMGLPKFDPNRRGDSAGGQRCPPSPWRGMGRPDRCDTTRCDGQRALGAVTKCDARVAGETVATTRPMALNSRPGLVQARTRFRSCGLQPISFTPYVR
jgi:hypothetical protein